MFPARGDLGERCEDEPASGHPRVGKDRVPLRLDEAPQIQDVHVDLPRPVAKRRDAAAAPLDFFDSLEEGAGRARPADRDHGIPEPALVRMADGPRAVEGGGGDDPRPPGDFRESAR